MLCVLREQPGTCFRIHRMQFEICEDLRALSRPVKRNDNILCVIWTGGQLKLVQDTTRLHPQAQHRCTAEVTVDPVLCVDTCLLYTSDAADEEDSVDLGGRRILKKKNK
eukprot:TRINITY_DN5339_c0_g1_i2.p2 TRINITY_DN5339_c0_g1~~TRINITY_DN5339_c0_g1_i2.p2  ORF type:complete len:109 (-),score=15.91 TRINITY_DN5339_c0_g1_i2:35-361(-)